MSTSDWVLVGLGIAAFYGLWAMGALQVLDLMRKDHHGDR